MRHDLASGTTVSAVLGLPASAGFSFAPIEHSGGLRVRGEGESGAYAFTRVMVYYMGVRQPRERRRDRDREDDRNR